MYAAGRGDLVEGSKAVDEDSLHHNQGSKWICHTLLRN